MAISRYTVLEAEIFGTGRYAEDRIIDEAGVLDVFLEDAAGKRLKVSFNAYLAFRKMDEGDAFHTTADINETSELGTRLYSVSDSEYLRWFHFESESVRKSQKLIHYCLTTIDSVIDVISFDPPDVSTI
ncbi:MAG TPA: hypothetical protein VN175_10800 [Rhizomicrobium sp.]|jgi:hypothetical protein|nr:hypothetical protein [Rhizomicrobium sp.]